MGEACRDNGEFCLDPDCVECNAWRERGERIARQLARLCFWCGEPIAHDVNAHVELSTDGTSLDFHGACHDLFVEVRVI